jgi:glycosyltransferase involved in cell wall biosynthesis
MKLGQAVRFHGWLPHARVQEVLKDCDFMALPSVREFGGAVVLESMALGVPPIVADYGGPSELVDEATGIRVPFRDKPTLVQGMRRAIETVVGAPSALDGLGAAGRQKISREFTWDAKAEQIVKVYKKILDSRKVC